MSPYWLWGEPRALSYVAAMAMVAFAALLVSGRRIRFEPVEMAGVVMLGLFLIYISVQPRMDGGHTKWIGILPFLASLAVMSDKDRRKCFLDFATIFAITLLPSVIVSLWIAAGGPITFESMRHVNPTMAAGGARALLVPGAVFVESNSIVLPWGGVLFRICGVYDEPGMVGTVGALSLAAFRFRLADWRAWIIFVGGVLSFSLAFMAMSAIGFIARAIFAHKMAVAVAVAPIVAAGFIATGVWHISAPGGVASAVQIETDGGPGDRMAVEGTRSIIAGRQELRQTGAINNRSLPEMEKLKAEFFAGDLSVKLFGIASDASVARGGVSQVWTRLLTDHGFVGFGLLMMGCAAVTIAAWVRSQYSAWSVVFVVLFAVSVYQRPVVWMPYTLLLLFAGPLFAAVPRRRVRTTRPLNTASQYALEIPSAQAIGAEFGVKRSHS
ncbi:hypothetical protein M8997_000195 [Phyllobacterium sp. 21LDTY02-6]|uniref:hypothetical protein n=1 Tax=Phyllobacterium sp. 21LDTY02-6 TaxID=2944903 RepID=UPI0020210333|nr:hypothetical protein [Phyllobacterium sp. 21LDTY02-6]MCO4315587.1 hypothetical protein [Phyllobacterium sp. 21LDTY02-6]